MTRRALGISKVAMVEAVAVVAIISASAFILALPKKAPSIENAMYEFHIYTSDWTTAQPYVQAFLENARSTGVSICMGEFDVFEAGCTGVNCHLDPNWQTDTQTLLSFCVSNGVNWAYFSYYSLGTSLQTPVPHSQILALLRSEIPA
jgi:hypothetical protein